MTGKHEELLHYLEKHDIDIAVIQETKFTSKTKMKATPNYELVRKDRGGDIKGGGVAFLVRHNIPFQRESTPNQLNDNVLELLTISVNNDNDSPLFLRNVYIPPASSCAPGYSPPLANLTNGLGNTFLILGDFNAHHHLWNSEDNEDTRGQAIAQWINDSEIGILNENTPTRVTESSCTSPDLSLASFDCLPTCQWSTETSLGSDHLPLHITMTSEIKRIKSTNRTYINFSKANWPQFTKYTEEKFSTAHINSNVHNSEKFFRKVLNKAAKQFIPAGRIPKVQNAMPTETANLVEERDRLRREDPVNNNTRIMELNKDINNSIKEHRQEKWLSHLDKCGAGTKQLWSTIKNLQTGPRKLDNQSIKFNGKHVHVPRKQANKFNQQFTPNTDIKATKPFRNLLRNLQKKTDDPEIEITEEKIIKAIKKSKSSKAIGPDGISPIMLKHLGPAGISFLSNLLTCCVNQSIIPPLWKKARIIPLLKPNKPADEGTSRRPISLLCPPAKILESTLLPDLEEALPLADHQHGFRKGRSTTTALQEITNHIRDNLNKKKPAHRTVMVAVDLTRAFDTVNHEILIKDIAGLQLNSRIKRFLAAYLRGRQTYVEYRGAKSNMRKMKQGVPQGGILSPPLFNLYMATMPTPEPDDKVVTYADDGTALGSGPKIAPICNRLNQYLDKLDSWYKARNLFISAPKSSATIFTTWSNEVGADLPISINGTKVPTIKDPKILGVTLDPTLSFKYHIQNIKNKVNSRNNILKALAGTSWGKEKELLLSTYKAVGQSVLNYCSPIWTPNTSQTQWNELQVAQNAALRTSIGCLKMSSITHLHAESKIMPVKEHNEMLSQQFLLSTLKPSHPNNRPLDHAPERLMSHSLNTKFADSIRPLAPDGAIDDQSYKEGLKKIHTNCVTNVIRQENDNRVLGAPAPRISSMEKTLPRRTRTILSQLRSGFSTHLNHYLNRINPNMYPDRCPDCGQGPHDTQHLFNCPAKPTSLDPWILWEDPPRAANFLGLSLGGEAEEDDDD